MHFSAVQIQSQPMKNKVLSICGILAPILYFIVVILGGVLRPGYSHLEQAVSELIELGAPKNFCSMRSL